MCEGCIYLGKLDEEFFNVILTEKNEAKYEEYLSKESYSGNLYQSRIKVNNFICITYYSQKREKL